MGAYDCDCINNLEYDRRERKAQLSQEGTTKDAISRQAAIDGLDGHYIERRNLNDWQAGWNAALDWMGSTYLDEFPSAQFDKDIDVPSNDTISRQVAIDADDDMVEPQESEDKE